MSFEVKLYALYPLCFLVSSMLCITCVCFLLKTLTVLTPLLLYCVFSVCFSVTSLLFFHYVSFFVLSNPVLSIDQCYFLLVILYSASFMIFSTLHYFILFSTDFTTFHHVLIVTETWLSAQGDEAKTVELAPSGFDV